MESPSQAPSQGEQQPEAFSFGLLIRKPRVAIRGLYKWVVGWAETPVAERALFAIAFIESSFFPIPPDPLLAAIAGSSPARRMRAALVCTTASVLGGLLGYLIGSVFYEVAGVHIVSAYGLEAVFSSLEARYTANAFFTVFVAAFTPVPYKVITIAAGVFSVNIPTFVLASIVGRGARFLGVAELSGRLGARYKESVERYIDVLSVLLVVLVIFGFYLLK